MYGKTTNKESAKIRQRFTAMRKMWLLRASYSTVQFISMQDMFQGSSPETWIQKI